MLVLPGFDKKIIGKRLQWLVFEETLNLIKGKHRQFDFTFIFTFFLTKSSKDYILQTINLIA